MRLKWDNGRLMQGANFVRDTNAVVQDAKANCFKQVRICKRIEVDNRVYYRGVLVQGHILPSP